MAGDAAPFLEAIFKEAAHHLGIVSQRNDGATYIPRRQDAEFIAQFAGRPPGIGDTDNSRQIELAIFT